MTNEEVQFFKGFGALESPPDNRKVFNDEVFGAPEMPEEFFSPYLVAAYLKNGTNDQKGRNSCVMESADKGSESLASWIVTPDIPDGGVIDYLFDLVDGKINLKEGIKKEIGDFSPEFGYHIAKQMDGNPNSPGTFIYMSGKVLQDVGISEESFHPSTSFNDAEVLRRSPSPEAKENAAKYKIERYSNTRKSLDSYKLGIWSGDANIVIGGYPTFSDMSQPQKVQSERRFGHANCFFGYSLDAAYSMGSWTKNYGLKVPLKIYNHPKFGNIFVRGTSSDNVVIIEGVHQVGKEWFPEYIFEGIQFYDKKFSPELEDRLAMLKTMREDVTGRVFAILGNKRYWITPGGAPDTIYEQGRGKLWPDVPPDEVPEFSRPDIRKYPYGGVWGNPSFSDFMSGKLGSI